MMQQTGTSVVPFNDNSKKITLQLMKDTTLEFPSLWASVYVSGPTADKYGFAEMLVQANCWQVEDPDLADFVVFTGGPDVNPDFYGEKAHVKTFWDTERDNDDVALYAQCLQEGIPMFGVCRGAQFLHVMNGGSLYQDVDNHHGDHNLWDVEGNRMVMKCSSVHHQMCIRNDGMHVLATSGKAQKRFINPMSTVEGNQQDVEAFFYRDTACLGVQGHPEYAGYYEYMQWCLEKIRDFLLEVVPSGDGNPDIELTEVELTDGSSTKVRRLKSEIVDMRDDNPQAIKIMTEMAA